MDFSKPKNLIILIIFLLIILSLSINASWAWFNFSNNKPIETSVSVLKFDFKTHNTYSEEISVQLTVNSPSNYSSGCIAPGVKGYHTFKFSNIYSGFPVEYTVTFDRDSSIFPSNMVFYKDSEYSTTITDGVVWDRVSLAKGATDEQTFGFEWKFETSESANSNDKIFKDQNISKAGILLKFTINAYQV